MSIAAAKVHRKLTGPEKKWINIQIRARRLCLPCRLPPTAWQAAKESLLTDFKTEFPEREEYLSIRKIERMINNRQSLKEDFSPAQIAAAIAHKAAVDAEAERAKLARLEVLKSLCDKHNYEISRVGILLQDTLDDEEEEEMTALHSTLKKYYEELSPHIERMCTKRTGEVENVLNKMRAKCTYLSWGDRGPSRGIGPIEPPQPLFQNEHCYEALIATDLTEEDARDAKMRQARVNGNNAAKRTAAALNTYKIEYDKHNKLKKEKHEIANTARDQTTNRGARKPLISAEEAKTQLAVLEEEFAKLEDALLQNIETQKQVKRDASIDQQTSHGSVCLAFFAPAHSSNPCTFAHDGVTGVDAHMQKVFRTRYQADLPRDSSTTRRRRSIAPAAAPAAVPTTATPPGEYKNGDDGDDGDVVAE